MAEVLEAKAPRGAPAGKQAVSPAAVHGPSDGFLACVAGMLSHHERMALRLRHSDGLAPGAIAARMHLPESIVVDLLGSAERTVRAAQRALIDAMTEASAPGRGARG